MTLAGSPDPPTRSLPSVWTSGEQGAHLREAIDALESFKKKDTTKVVVRFKAVGNAPIMRQNLYKISASNRFQAVIQFLRKELGWKAGDPLVQSTNMECMIAYKFTYINLAFAPAPDDTVSNLFKSFATEGHLIVNYSTTAAWG